MATFTSQPDSTTGYDTYLYSSSSLFNYGADPTLRLTYGIGNLLKFDLSTLAGATITSATLSFFHDSSQWQEWGTLTVHRILSANSGWIEGNQWGNYAYTDGENSSCWDYKIYGSVGWAGSAGCSLSGTDYYATAMGTLYIGNVNSPAGTERVINLSTSEMSNMISGNYGFYVTNTNSGVGLYFSVGSSDNDTAAYRPKLVIEYTAGATSQIKKLSGINQAELKKVSGLAIASIKKISGISNS